MSQENKGVWIFSELCAYEVGKVLAKIKVPEGKASVLARSIGRVVIKDLPAKDFVTTIAKEWNMSIPAAQIVTTEVKNTVLKPIAASLWKNLQIDIGDLTKIPEGPTARVTTMEKPLAAAKPVSGEATASAATPVRPAAPAPAARTMEFKQMTDVKKPQQPSGVKTIKPKVEAPKPDVTAPRKPFGLSEVEPKAPPAEHHDLTEYHDDHPMKPTP